MLGVKEVCLFLDVCCICWGLIICNVKDFVDYFYFWFGLKVFVFVLSCEFMFYKFSLVLLLYICDVWGMSFS